MGTPPSRRVTEDSLATETWLYEKGPRENPARFVERYYPLIVQFARRAVRGPEAPIDFDDVAHEALAKLISPTERKWTFDRDRGRFRAYLYQVVRNAARDQLRSRKRRLQVGDCGVGGGKDVLAACPDASGDDLAERISDLWQEDIDRVVRAFAAARKRATAVTREAFALLKISGVSGEEAARRLGVPPRVVYDAGWRFLKMVKQELKGTGLEDGDLEGLAQLVWPWVEATAETAGG
jgi:RNA polymerase sigma factor (sigma-70 family)